VFEEGMNENLYTNDKGMRVHAFNGKPMKGGSKRPPFGGTLEASRVPNPMNSDYTTRAVSDKGEYKSRMKSADALDKMRE
jgi:hypothetical protein